MEQASILYDNQLDDFRCTRCGKRHEMCFCENEKAPAGTGAIGKDMIPHFSIEAIGWK